MVFRRCPAGPGTVALRHDATKQLIAGILIHDKSAVLQVESSSLVTLTCRDCLLQLAENEFAVFWMRVENTYLEEDDDDDAASWFLSVVLILLLRLLLVEELKNWQ